MSSNKAEVSHLDPEMIEKIMFVAKLNLSRGPISSYTSCYSWVEKHHLQSESNLFPAYTIIYLRILQAYLSRKTANTVLLPTFLEYKKEFTAPKTLDLSPAVANSVYHLAADCQEAFKLIGIQEPPQYLARKAFHLFMKYEEPVLTLMRRFHLDDRMRFRTFAVGVLQQISDQVYRIADVYVDFHNIWEGINWDAQQFKDVHVDADLKGEANAQIKTVKRAVWQYATGLSYRNNRALIVQSRARETYPSRKMRLLYAATLVYMIAQKTGVKPTLKPTTQNLLDDIAKIESEGTTLIDAVLELVNTGARTSENPNSNPYETTMDLVIKKQEFLECIHSLSSEISTGGRLVYAGQKRSRSDEGATTPVVPNDFLIHISQRAEIVLNKALKEYQHRRISISCVLLYDESKFSEKDIYVLGERYKSSLDHEQPLLSDKVLKAMSPAEADDSSVADSSTPDTLVLDTPMLRMTKWISSLLEIDQVEIPGTLLGFLKAANAHDVNGWYSVVLPNVNRCLQRLSAECLMVPSTFLPLIVIEQNPIPGRVRIRDGYSKPESDFLRSIVLVYYQALEAMLVLETQRLGTFEHHRFVMSDTLQRGILACSVLLISKSFCVNTRTSMSTVVSGLDIDSILQVCECSALSFVSCLEPFLNALTLEEIVARDKHVGSPLRVTLPPILVYKARLAETQALDCLVWYKDWKVDQQFVDLVARLKHDTNVSKVEYWPLPCLKIPEEMHDFGESGQIFRSPGDTEELFHLRNHASSIMERILKMITDRIHFLCTKIKTDIATEGCAASLMRHLLRAQTDIFFDRHLDQVLLCCIYAVDKRIRRQSSVTFGEIIEVYSKTRASVLGDITVQRILRYVRLGNESDKGDIIKFYNVSFLPLAQKPLTKSNVIRRAADKWEKRGQMYRSPAL